MSKPDLTRNEALELITPIVDDEVGEALRAAFFEYIEDDEVVKLRYESIKRLKDVVSSRCPCTKAPPHLRRRIAAFLSHRPDTEPLQDEEDEPIYDVPCDQTVDGGSDASEADQSDANGTGHRGDSSSFIPRSWLYAAAAALLLVSLLAAQYLLGLGGELPPLDTYNIEEYAYTHFMKHQGRMVPPTISTASLANAELELANSFNMATEVPTLENADFKGIVYTNFVDGFKTPMLEYYLPSDDQYIYIFVFDVNDLNKNEQLFRSREAVKSCVKADDFHIRNVNGKHVVSWKWNNTWYAAVSNHDGRTLASLVMPLNYERSND